MEITIKWQFEGKWRDYDDMDYLACCSRNHAMNLFSMDLPVVIKETQDGADRYIVNTSDLLAQYRRSGKQVMLLSDCTPSPGSIERVGFWGD